MTDRTLTKQCVVENDIYTFLQDGPFMLCLQKEVQFLKSGDMALLKEPKDLYKGDDGSHWNDSMAYLNMENDKNLNTKSISSTSNKMKMLLKCGFIKAGRPSKVWAFNILNASIQIDDLENKWYQIGNDMLLTKYTDLEKYRSRVQCAVEFGLAKMGLPELEVTDNSDSDLLVAESVQKCTDTTRASKLSSHPPMNQNSVDLNKGVFCCAGIDCKMKGTQSAFILFENIRHKCYMCKKPMHGGICGAEASTIISDTDCGHNEVICSICITKKQTNHGMCIYCVTIFCFIQIPNYFVL